MNENDKNRAFFSQIQAIWELAEIEGPEEIMDEEFEQQKQRKIRTPIFLVTCLIGQGISFLLSFSYPKFSNYVSILAALTMVILVMLIFARQKTSDERFPSSSWRFQEPSLIPIPFGFAISMTR